MLYTPENTPKAEVYCNGSKVEGFINWVNTDEGVAEIMMSYWVEFPDSIHKNKWFRVPITHRNDEYSFDHPTHTYLLYGNFEVRIPKC